MCISLLGSDYLKVDYIQSISDVQDEPLAHSRLAERTHNLCRSQAKDIAGSLQRLNNGGEILGNGLCSGLTQHDAARNIV